MIGRYLGAYVTGDLFRRSHVPADQFQNTFVENPGIV